MDLLMWQIRKNCSLFITSGTLSQLTGNTSICNTSKIDFRRLEALSCGVWPSPGFSLLSSRISLQNREKCRFEPTFKKACPARLSERKSLISSGFRRVRGLQKRPQNGHPRHSCTKDSKCRVPKRNLGFESLTLRQKPSHIKAFAHMTGLFFSLRVTSAYMIFGKTSGVPAGLPCVRQSQDIVHYICRGDLGLVIQMAVNIRRRADVAVSQPLLNLLQRHIVCQKQ